MTIIPVSDHIVAIPLRPRTMREGDVTEGGIVMPETAEEKDGMVPMVAKVMAVGPGRYTSDGILIPVSCKAGDRIVYRAPYGNFSRFKLQDQPFLLLEERDILAILEDSLVQPVAAMKEIRS